MVEQRHLLHITATCAPWTLKKNAKYTEAKKHVGETKVRIGTRMYEHINTDKGSSIYKHKVRNNLVITEDNFEILDRGFPKTLDRKLAEAIYVKEMDPVLNRQKETYKLLLFN